MAPQFSLLPLPDSKVCPACGETKPLTAFTPRPSARDGRRNECRDCRRRKDYPWREANREHLLAYGKAYRRDNPEKHLAWKDSRPEEMRVRKINDGALARGARTLISLEDYRALVARCQGRCQHCGSTTDISVDHIVALQDGGAHYIDNLQLLCRSCNTIKEHKERKARRMRRIQCDWVS